MTVCALLCCCSKERGAGTQGGEQIGCADCIDREGATHQESPFGIILDALSKAAAEGEQAPAAPTKEGAKPDSKPSGADEKPASPALS